MPVRLAVMLTVASLPITTVMRAQPSPPVLDRRFVDLLHVDSAAIVLPQISPDGRWVAFSMKMPSGKASIWMASVPNGRPYQVTSNGYLDNGVLTFSPSGDRVFFISNRPTRDGSSVNYAMALPIDKQSGKPSGPPRQVTTDANIWDVRPSPDGRWLVYSTRVPSSLKVIPINGGNARALVTASGEQIANATFSKDMKSILYSQYVQSGFGVLKRVPLGGGAPVILAQETGTYISPYPADPSDVLKWRFGRNVQLELLDANKRRLTALEATGWMAHSVGEAEYRSDGRGLIGVKKESRYAIRRLSLDGGAIERIGGMMPHTFSTVDTRGNVYWVRRANDKRVLEGWDAAGRPLKAVSLPMPLGIGATTDSRFLTGAGSFPNMGATAPAFLVDPATGSVRKIADSVYVQCCDYERRTEGWLVAHGDNRVLTSFDTLGNPRVMRSFSQAEYRDIADISLHGSRVVFARRSPARDSVTIFVADGPSGAAHRVAALSLAAGSDGSDMASRFSLDGTKLAVTHNSSDGPRITVFALHNGNGGATELTSFAAAADGGLAYPVWISEALILTKSWNAKLNRHELVLHSINPNRAPALVSGNESADINQWRVTADHRRVIYDVEVTGGSTIWTAELLPRGKQK